MLRLPLFGGLLREILAARFARTLGMLLVNGVPLLAALGIVQEVLGNNAAQKRGGGGGGKCQDRPGHDLALASARHFPARLVHLLRLGEETAQLGPLALRAADIQRSARAWPCSAWSRCWCPAITILMGAAVAGIVSSLLLAMLSLNDIAQ